MRSLPSPRALFSAVALTTLALAALPTPQAHACRCARVTPFLDVAHKAPVVLRLKALDDGGAPGSRFAVVEVVKGSFAAKEVVIAQARTSCDYPLEPAPGAEVFLVPTDPKTRDDGRADIAPVGGCSEDYVLIRADGTVQLQDATPTADAFAQQLRAPAPKPAPKPAPTPAPKPASTPASQP